MTQTWRPVPGVTNRKAPPTRQPGPPSLLVTATTRKDGRVIVQGYLSRAAVNPLLEWGAEYVLAEFDGVGHLRLVPLAEKDGHPDAMKLTRQIILGPPLRLLMDGERTRYELVIVPPQEYDDGERGERVSESGYLLGKMEGTVLERVLALAGDALDIDPRTLDDVPF